MTSQSRDQKWQKCQTGIFWPSITSKLKMVSQWNFALMLSLPVSITTKYLRAISFVVTSQSRDKLWKKNFPKNTQTLRFNNFSPQWDIDMGFFEKDSPILSEYWKNDTQQQHVPKKSYSHSPDAHVATCVTLYRQLQSGYLFKLNETFILNCSKVPLQHIKKAHSHHYFSRSYKLLKSAKIDV